MGFKVEVFDHNRHYNVEYPHRHDFFYEVLYIKKGSGKYVIDFQEYEIKPETLFFVSPGQVHEIHYSEDIYGYIFLFNEDFLSISGNENYTSLFDGLVNSAEALSVHSTKLSENFTSVFLQAIENASENDNFSETICRNCLSTILLMSARSARDRNPVYSHKSKGAELVRKFKSLVNEKYAEYLSVKDYAHLLSVTPGHLNETVKMLVGINANGIIDNKLLVEIKRLLAYTEMDISEIAFRFNFKDQSYFSRFFKSKTGFTPKEFRSNHLK